MRRHGRLTDAGPRTRLPHAAREAGSTGPVRMCVGCRERGLRSVLLRVVAVADGAGQQRAVVDVRRALSGRGAWMHADLRCLDLAEKRHAFPRALRTGPLDTSQVRAFLEESSTHDRGTHDRSRHDSSRHDSSHARSEVVSSGPESGLEADGPPMSTQR